VKRLAKISALSAKAKSGAIRVIEDFTYDNPKTSAYASMLKNLECDNKRSLLVTSDMDKNLYLSSRNVKKNEVMTASGLNTLDIMKAGTLVLSEGSLSKIKKALSNN